MTQSHNFLTSALNNMIIKYLNSKKRKEYTTKKDREIFDKNHAYVKRCNEWLSKCIMYE